MKKKIVWLTHWTAKDKNKEYPHGYGFEPPIVEFAQDRDPAEINKLVAELSNGEFECYGATPREIIDGEFEICGIAPVPDSDEWVMRDIDLILDNADFADNWKTKEIAKVVKKYFGNVLQSDAKNNL